MFGLIETVLLSTHNIVLVENKENYFLLPTFNLRSVSGLKIYIWDTHEILVL